MIKSVLSIFVIAVVMAIMGTSASARNWHTTFDISTPVIGQESTLGGCGYEPSTFLKVYVVWDSTYVGRHFFDGLDFNTQTDASGCFTGVFTPTSIGIYELYAYQPNKPGKVITARGFTTFII